MIQFTRAPKIHFISDDDQRPVCGSEAFYAIKSVNYVEVDCRRCKEKINKQYRELKQTRGGMNENINHNTPNTSAHSLLR